MTSSKNPTPLATNPFLSPSQKNCWPKLLHELSLEDGLESFLEWENQFLQFGRLVGSSEHPKQYVDCQLLNLLEESVGPVLKDLDFEAFAEEVFKIFDDDEETVIISNPISWANLNSILKISKPMVLSSVVEAPTVKVVNDRIVDEEEAMKNQAGRQFLEAEGSKNKLKSMRRPFLRAKQMLKTRSKTIPLPMSKTNHWIQTFWRPILRARQKPKLK